MRHKSEGQYRCCCMVTKRRCCCLWKSFCGVSGRLFHEAGTFTPLFYFFTNYTLLFNFFYKPHFSKPEIICSIFDPLPYN